jgi:hypothetical protein
MFVSPCGIEERRQPCLQGRTDAVGSVEGMGESAIARQLGINRSSVYRLVGEAPSAR